MIVTKIEVQKHNKNKVNLYIDDEFYCGLSLEAILKNRIKKGQELTQSQLDYLKNDTEKELALNKAVQHMAKAQKTEKELKTFLTEKGFEKDTISYVLEKLKDYGYVNDANYAKSYILFKSKQQGSRKIMFDLKKKGIKETAINEALDLYSVEKESIDTVAEKYLRNKELDLKNRQKAYRYLVSKGFLTDDIISCLNKIFKGEN